MIESDVERRLLEAFDDARTSVDPNPDLFERVNRSLDEDADRRRWRRRMAVRALAVVAASATVAVVLGDYDHGRFTMPWWLIELLTNATLVGIAVVLGPFIKRFGRAYAADVFRANPRTGKSYLVLTDVAYYLIFSAFILFTVNFKDIWQPDRADQWRQEAARVGGILLIMGVLHAANVVALPVIGNLLSSHGLEAPARHRASKAANGPDASSASPLNLGPGTFVVRIEAADTTPNE